MKIIDNIYDILEHMQKRTAMFLGNDYTFETLNGFITGYTFAATANQLQKQGCPDFTYFSTWLLGHLEEHHGPAGGWHWQIHNRNLNDDKKAFEEFFYYLDIFKKSERVGRSVIIDQQAFAYSIEGEGKQYCSGNDLETFKKIADVESPGKIDWITMTNSSTVWIDYRDNNGDSLFDAWYINEPEAKRKLKLKFGSFKLG